jgi:hypothetical protein
MRAINRIFSKHYSFLALALLVFAVLGCGGNGDNNNNRNRSSYSGNSGYSSSYNNSSYSSSYNDSSVNSGYSGNSGYNGGSVNSGYNSSSVNSGYSGSNSYNSGSDSGSSEWENKLAGTQLTWAHNDGTFGDQVDIWLCSSGEYSIKRSMTGTSTGGVGTGTMADENSESGKWSVNSSTLIFKPNGKAQWDAQLSQGSDSKAIRLNKRSFRVGGNSKCN